MGAPIVRTFNALSGEEVKEIILNEIRRHLEADYRFRRNLAYPQISWRWKLAVNAYPLDPAQFNVEVGPKTSRAPEAEPIPPGTAEIEIDLTGGREVTAPAGGETPDAARRDAGLGVPIPRTAPGPGNSRVVVDAPRIPDPKQSKPGEAPVETNAPSGGRIFGRRVTQKTTAAPEGASAGPQAGTKPGVEEVQEIQKREGAAPDEKE